MVELKDYFIPVDEQLQRLGTFWSSYYDGSETIRHMLQAESELALDLVAEANLLSGGPAPWLSLTLNRISARVFSTPANIISIGSLTDDLIASTWRITSDQFQLSAGQITFNDDLPQLSADQLTVFALDVVQVPPQSQSASISFFNNDPVLIKAIEDSSNLGLTIYRMKQIVASVHGLELSGPVPETITSINSGLFIVETDRRIYLCDAVPSWAVVGAVISPYTIVGTAAATRFPGQAQAFSIRARDWCGDGSDATLATYSAAGGDITFVNSQQATTFTATGGGNYTFRFPVTGNAGDVAMFWAFMPNIVPALYRGTLPTPPILPNPALLPSSINPADFMQKYIFRGAWLIRSPADSTTRRSLEKILTTVDPHTRFIVSS